ATNATNAGSLSTSCSGCVKSGMIAGGAVGSHSHSLSITTTASIAATIYPGGTTACGNDCPSGTTVVSGLCRNNGDDVFLQDIFPAGNHWCCHYSNNTANNLTIAIASVCASISTVSLP